MERREREIAAGSHSRSDEEVVNEDPEYDAAAAREFARQHEAYGSHRWSLLSEEDKAFATERGFDFVIRDVGIGGLRYKNQVKCLHLHYAHWLVTRDNIVGGWVHDELMKRAAATRGTTTGG